MPIGRVSGRPESIKVAVIDPDSEWSEMLANDLGKRIGATVVTMNSSLGLESVIGGCHVLVLGRAADPALTLLHQIRSRYDERQLPIIYADRSEEDGSEEYADEQQIQATRAGANAVFDRSMHANDFGLMEKLVYSLACE